MTLQQKSTWARILPIVITVVLFGSTLVSTTLAISKSQEQKSMTLQMAQVLIVIEEMQHVDRDMALQVEKNRGESSVELAVIRSRIDNIGLLLQDIKEAVMGTHR